MKVLIITCFVLCQSVLAQSQQYSPDFLKDYPFSDNATPFIYQKKAIPFAYQNKSGIIPPLQVPETEVLEATLPDTTNETPAERIYRKRLVNYETIFKNGKQGIKNAQGEVLVPAIYDRIDPFGYVVLAQLHNKWGILDGRGGTVLPFEWQFHEMSNGYILLSNGKRGVVYNDRMEVVLDQPAIEVGSVYSYPEEINIYKFRNEKGWQVFDVNGYHLFDGYFDDFFHYADKFFALSDKGSWWLFSLDGKKLSKEPFKKIEPFSDKHLDVFVARKDSLLSKKFFLLSSEGRIISNAFDGISTPYDSDPDQDWVEVRNDMKWGILNFKGEIILPVEYDKLEDGYNGYFKLWKEGKVVQWISIKTGKLYNELPKDE